MKKTVAIIIMLIMFMVQLYPVAVAAELFPDLIVQLFDAKGKPLKDNRTGEYIYGTHWAVKDIMKSTQIGLIVGYNTNGEYVFKPDQPITRAEFIKMAMVLSTNRTFDFDTIPSSISHWAGKYVKVAEMQNVIEKDKYTDKNLDEPITRIEMICILSRIQINMKSIAQNREGKLQYTDIGNLTEEEKALLLHAAKYTLINDMLETTTFMPNQNLTRAEATVAIMRIY